MESSLPLLSKERNRIHVMAAGVNGVNPAPLMLSGRRATGAESTCACRLHPPGPTALKWPHHRCVSSHPAGLVSVLPGATMLICL